MDGCVFCKIVAGELPSHKVYEDKEYLAFLDINPLAPGHTLIVPKKHYRFVWDVPESEFGNYMAIAQKIAKALQGTFGTDMISSKVVGEEVPHAHFWLFPNPDEAVGDKKDFEKNVEKIRNALS